jgi:hypothetical protein
MTMKEKEELLKPGSKYQLVKVKPKDYVKIPLKAYSGETNLPVKQYRVRAIRDFGDVKEGDIGGFVSGFQNLDTKDNSWIYHDACVLWYSRVEGEAQVRDNAQVIGNAVIKDTATIRDSVYISGNPIICGNTVFSGMVDIESLCGHIIDRIEDRMKGQRYIYSHDLTIMGYQQKYPEIGRGLSLETPPQEPSSRESANGGYIAYLNKEELKKFLPDTCTAGALRLELRKDEVYMIIVPRNGMPYIRICRWTPFYRTKGKDFSLEMDDKLKEDLRSYITLLKWYAPTDQLKELL